MTVLNWETGTYGSDNGWLPVGEKRVAVATVYRSVVRDDPEPFRMRTGLPGFSSKTWSFKTEDEAKAKAERLIRSFGIWIATAVEASDS